MEFFFTESEQKLFSSECYWQDMERLKKMKKFANDKIYSDCEFLVGPEDSTAETITGHKLLFIIESPVFESMMAGSFIEAQKGQIIRIDDVLPHHFKNFRDLIYHNELGIYSNFSIAEIFELYRIADKYLVSSISTNCINHLLSLLEKCEIESLLMIFEFAVKIKNKTLQSSIKNVLSTRHAANILNNKINDFDFEPFYEYIRFVSCIKTVPKNNHNSHDPYYSSNSYNRQGNFNSIKKSNSLVLPISIFKAINDYFKNKHLFENKIQTLKVTSDPSGEEADPAQIKSESNNNEMNKTEDKNVIEPESLEKEQIAAFKDKLLSLVKFDEMTVLEFINGPGVSNLLGTNQKYKLLVKLCKPK